eukprot:XP_001702795.1 predicted protein [Chlamydomonas reinhardtii]
MAPTLAELEARLAAKGAELQKAQADLAKAEARSAKLKTYLEGFRAQAVSTTALADKYRALQEDHGAVQAALTAAQAEAAGLRAQLAREATEAEKRLNAALRAARQGAVSAGGEGASRKSQPEAGAAEPEGGQAQQQSQAEVLRLQQTVGQLRAELSAARDQLGHLLEQQEQQQALADAARTAAAANGTASTAAAGGRKRGGRGRGKSGPNGAAGSVARAGESSDSEGSSWDGNTLAEPAPTAAATEAASAGEAGAQMQALQALLDEIAAGGRALRATVGGMAVQLRGVSRTHRLLRAAFGSGPGGGGDPDGMEDDADAAFADLAGFRDEEAGVGTTGAGAAGTAATATAASGALALVQPLALVRRSRGRPRKERPPSELLATLLDGRAMCPRFEQQRQVVRWLLQVAREADVLIAQGQQQGFLLSAADLVHAAADARRHRYDQHSKLGPQQRSHPHDSTSHGVAGGGAACCRHGSIVPLSCLVVSWPAAMAAPNSAKAVAPQQRGPGHNSHTGHSSGSGLWDAGGGAAEGALVAAPLSTALQVAAQLLALERLAAAVSELQVGPVGQEGGVGPGWLLPPLPAELGAQTEAVAAAALLRVVLEQHQHAQAHTSAAAGSGTGNAAAAKLPAGDSARAMGVVKAATTNAGATPAEPSNSSLDEALTASLQEARSATSELAGRLVGLLLAAAPTSEPGAQTAATATCVLASAAGGGAGQRSGAAAGPYVSALQQALLVLCHLLPYEQVYGSVLAPLAAALMAAIAPLGGSAEGGLDGGAGAAQQKPQLQQLLETCSRSPTAVRALGEAFADVACQALLSTQTSAITASAGQGAAAATGRVLRQGLSSACSGVGVPVADELSLAPWVVELLEQGRPGEEAAGGGGGSGAEHLVQVEAGHGETGARPALHSAGAKAAAVGAGDWDMEGGEDLGGPEAGHGGGGDSESEADGAGGEPPGPLQFEAEVAGSDEADN